VADVTMPRLSDTMTEGTIARWLKQQGDQVEKGETLVEIETDKATMELEAYESGVVEAVLAQEGETVAIGKPIARIGSGNGQAATPRAEPKPKADQGAERTQAGTTEAPPAPGDQVHDDQPPPGEGATDAEPSGSGGVPPPARPNNARRD
jgi:pyruvate dehydrogenase E2 component (dihydrolipoamide acetyltransferase)